MPPDKPPVRPWLLVLTRVVLCAAVGVAIGTAFWAGSLTQKGKSIPAALRGEMEDAIGVLQALTVIGGLVGAAVGCVYGLVTVEARKSS
jgi:hypothetical protein